MWVRGGDHHMRSRLDEVVATLVDWVPALAHPKPNPNPNPSPTPSPNPNPNPNPNQVPALLRACSDDQAPLSFEGLGVARTL